MTKIQCEVIITCNVLSIIQVQSIRFVDYLCTNVSCLWLMTNVENTAI